MKKTRHVIYVAAIVISFLLIPIALAADLPEQFVDFEYGYSIRHPSSWSAKIIRSGIVLADIHSNDNRSGLQIRVTRFQNRMNQFIDSYASEFARTMQASLIYKSQRMIGSINGYTITFRAKRGGREYFLKSYILPIRNESRIYIFQAGTPYEMRNQVEPVLDAIADSFMLGK